MTGAEKDAREAEERFLKAEMLKEQAERIKEKAEAEGLEAKAQRKRREWDKIVEEHREADEAQLARELQPKFVPWTDLLTDKQRREFEFTQTEKEAAHIIDALIPVFLAANPNHYVGPDLFQKLTLRLAEFMPFKEEINL